MSRIKECFVSRFGDDGLIVEADFSQLEVYGLAILSGDEVLKDDLLSGRDLHRMRAAELFGVPESSITHNQRFLAKRLSFQLQYGAGANSMAKKNGITKELAEKFIFLYYDRYKDVKKWQDSIAEEVKASREPSSYRTAKGVPAGIGKHISATGRIYTFLEYDAPDWSRTGEPQFSPTEMKNYPVQGFATADIMALFRGMLFREWIGLHNRNEICLVNTVHDSIMLDIRRERLEHVTNLIHSVARQLPDKIFELWGIRCDVPLPINVKSGPDWASLK